MRDVRLPIDGKRPLRLQLVPQDIENVVRAVERYGQERMIQLAALILEGRVALTDSLTLLRRAARHSRCGYGILAVWVPCISHSQHGCEQLPRTSFGCCLRRVRPVGRPDLGVAVDYILNPAPRTGAGRAYLDMLHAVVQRTDIETVILYLRKATTPLTREQRDGALEILDELWQSQVQAREMVVQRATDFLYNTLQKFRKHIEPGRLMFNPPDRMQLWTTERVEVRLTCALDLDAELLRDLRGLGEPQLEEIPTTLLMAVFLKSDGFNITAYSDEEQIVTRKESTTWEFDIRAIKTGMQRLILRVSLRIPIAGQFLTAKSIPVHEAIINVQVRRTALAVKFVSANWQWFIGTMIAIAAVVVAILYH